MSDWAPSTLDETGTVTEFAAASMHDLLDRPGEAPRAGEALPFLWHWLTFLPAAPQAQIGKDGHPLTGGFLPPVGHRKRMFAGGRLAADGALTVGGDIRRTSTVTDVTTKQGATGELVFVTVDRRLTGGGDLREVNDIVYRLPDAATPPAARDDTEDWEGSRRVGIDPSLLFRFSALTYNAHRIHYDRDYATQVEGYPGLVVHGPLQAVILADAVERSGRRIRDFRFRSVSPAFDQHPLEVRWRAGAEPGTLELGVFSDGRRTMKATAVVDDQEGTP